MHEKKRKFVESNGLKGAFQKEKQTQKTTKIKNEKKTQLASGMYNVLQFQLTTWYCVYVYILYNLAMKSTENHSFYHMIISFTLQVMMYLLFLKETLPLNCVRLFVKSFPNSPSQKQHDISNVCFTNLINNNNK